MEIRNLKKVRESCLFDILYPDMDRDSKMIFFNRMDYDKKAICTEPFRFSAHIRNLYLRLNLDYPMTSLKDLLFVKIERMLKVKNCGIGIINNLSDFFLENMVIITDKEYKEIKKFEKNNDFTLNKVKKKFYEENDLFNYDLFWKFFLLDAKDNLQSVMSENCVLKYPHVKKMCKDFILQTIILNSNHIEYLYLKKEQLEKIIPLFFYENEILNVILDELISEHKIYCWNNSYCKWIPDVKEWIEQISGRMKPVAELGIQGLSTKEIADRLNVSGQTIRNIKNKYVCSKIIVQEDKYKYWYTNYNLSFEDMYKLFNIDEYVYNYLKLLFKKGSKNINEIKNDLKIHEDIYKGFKLDLEV